MSWVAPIRFLGGYLPSAWRATLLAAFGAVHPAVLDRCAEVSAVTHDLAPFDEASSQRSGESGAERGKRGLVLRRDQVVERQRSFHVIDRAA